MSLANELQRLADLKTAGVLTETEFEQAKAKLLREESHPGQSLKEGAGQDSLGHAANRYVTFQMVMAVIGILVFLLVFAPRMCSMLDSFPKSRF